MNKVQLRGAGYDMAIDTGKVKYDSIQIKTSGGIDFYYKGHYVAHIDTPMTLPGDVIHIEGLKGKFKPEILV